MSEAAEVVRQRIPHSTADAGTDYRSTDNNTAEPPPPTAQSQSGPTPSTAPPQPSTGEEERNDSTFECNICLDIARDAVISLCGHLFCWPCLHQWIETRPTRPVCPLCKAGISKDKVIPVYGKDNPDRKDPREKEMPPRPQAQRPEPETNYNMFNNSFFGGFGPGFGMPGQNNGGLQFSFGIGAFPFTFLSWQFGAGNNNNNNQRNGQPQTPQEREEQFLSRAFLWVAIFFIIWLILA